ncbi:MAG: Cas10/Cmr2 second palm domain-containing protein [Myxococcales bacterium]|jgi:hypothetical protein
MRWLYRYEAKGIQSYILATERLREMKGASALVESLKDLLEKALGDRGTRRMVAAGNATLCFEDESKLREFAEHWPMLLSRKVPGLQIVQAWAPIQGTEREALKVVLERLESDRNRPWAELPEAGALVARSSRTGRPAVKRGSKDSEGLLDAATRAKVTKVRNDADDLLAAKLSIGSRELVSEMEEFDEGYVAVVHADGNGVGKRITEDVCNWDWESQSRFSNALTEATRQAAISAIDHLDTFSKGKKLPLRPLVLGGDDFTVILSARHAIAFTEHFLRKFEEATRAAEALKGGFTACAGIALVKPGFPFHAAYELAEALCSHAKRTLPGEPTPSGFAFHRVTTATFESLDTVMRDELEVRDARFEKGRRNGALMGGPWAIGGSGRNVEALDRLAKAALEAPRGAIREWLRVVRFDLPRAEALWGRLLQNLSEVAPDTAESLKETLRELGVSPEKGHADGWTPMLDALILASVAGEKRFWRECA